MSTSEGLFGAVQRFFADLPNTLVDLFDQLRHIQITPLRVVLAGLIFWLCLVRALRWRRYYAIHSKYGPKWDNGRGTLSPQEAQSISHVTMNYDMPLLMNYSLAFALFKTYGIPSISKLLLATKQLSTKAFVSRRYTDTELLIATFFTCPLSGFVDPSFAEQNRAKGPDAQPAEDPRAMIAVARMNWLHSRHNISNGDYLYTLSLFILEPIAWAKRFGWRPLSPMEQDGYFRYWVDIGAKMKIQDIPETLEALEDFAERYEATYMVPAQSNHETAIHTLDELLSAVPDALGLKSFGQRISICLMSERVRVAMMFPEQPWICHFITKSSLGLVAGFQHYFMLPRWSPRTLVHYDIKTHFEPGTCPRLHSKKWPARPWYRAEATGLGYLRDKFLVAMGWFTEMPSPNLKSGGYRIEELGPIHLENKGHEEVFREAAELQGCPIAGPWSPEARHHVQNA
ncbi:hypothetical protein CPB83DRAFT_861677 [Crepidotus variabilis]|uniref:ER-bound oxygenase mpaB/mpaB'/Rubber oxygenase catalytic domain-containing protein n=1 Tax=Crepidotus variabilis TaxID=179855 RepID=A0A9P6E810_9AGAR|nr:hypothetical protein CPB83DRAFT_861677 [Crepidotus variabilis]